MHKIIRFIEIDLNFLITPLTIPYKALAIFQTNRRIFTNLLLRKKNFPSVKLNNKSFFYDTPFATKTFLTAVYDLYLVTLRKEIFLRGPLTIIDIGANIGQFMFACKTLFPDSTVYSVEPDSEIFKILRKNVKNFNNVIVYNFALSNIKKKIKFYISNDFSEWSSLKRIEGKEYNVSVVNAEKGDSLFKKIDKVDLLKIDVEGSEYDVVLGLVNTLKKTKYLLIEVSLERNNEDEGSSMLITFLLQNNFHIHNIGRIFSEGRGKRQGAVDILFKNNKLT